MTDHDAEYLAELTKEAETSLAEATTSTQLESWRIKYLGRKGAVPLLLRRVKSMPPAQRRQAGQAGNELRRLLEKAYTEKKAALEPEQPSSTAPRQTTSLREAPVAGHLHPLTQALRQAREIFAAMGFLIVEGPDIEEIKYNFDQLNIPFEHPARAETDTFYLNNFPDLLLRTHVSTLQLRGVIEHDLKAPFRMMYYGPSYRSEKEDATHLSHFQQYEFIVVDESVTLADLKAIVQTFYSLFFGRELDIRFRPAYYPFVEPGLDVDMRDRTGSRKQWLEMAGAGMVHPSVLRNMNVDHTKYRGIALGGGLDRLVMLKHNIPDARLLYSGDLRFLKQF
jgi:phenylalanyl-tRNA synthetase alpha chain